MFRQGSPGWFLWVGMIIGSALGGGAAERDSAHAGGLPPLVVDEERPLLLENAGESAPPPAQAKQAHNTPCFVCHDNYKTEPLALLHAKEAISCVDCHGPSNAHQNDENNVTPPDKMFAPDVIEVACRECHSEHNAPAIQIIARWQERSGSKADSTKAVCTDCHGRHRLAKRTVRWEKTTGRLLPSSDPAR